MAARRQVPHLRRDAPPLTPLCDPTRSTSQENFWSCPQAIPHALSQTRVSNQEHGLRNATEVVIERRASNGKPA